jgi:GTPase SAR1 family protein
MRQRAVAAAAAKVAGTMRLKLLVLGDAGAGKSCLLRRFNADSNATKSNAAATAPSAPPLKFDLASTPTVGVEFVAASVVGSRAAEGSGAGGRQLRVQANFFDLSGDPSYAKVRAEFFAEQHGVLFCFDLSSRVSWEHVESHWWPEAHALAVARGPDGQPLPGAQPPALHAVVVGCKADLVEAGGGGVRAVSERDAKQWCKSRGASYFECSAKSGSGVAKSIEYFIEHAQAEAKINGAPPTPAASASSSSPSSSQPQRPPSASPHASPSPSPSPSPSASPPSGSPSSSSSSGSANINELSLSELRRECSKRGISTDDCLEKSDVLQRLREHLAREREARSNEATEGKLKEERAREAVLADVARWARGKDVRVMLNDIHGWTESSAPQHFLPAHASLAPVAAAYKRALLKIHPDKVDVARDGLPAHWRATEMFKTVNAAFESFKKINEKRMSAGGADGSSASAAAAAEPRYSPSSSPTPTVNPTPRTRATSRR